MYASSYVGDVVIASETILGARDTPNIVILGLYLVGKRLEKVMIS